MTEADRREAEAELDRLKDLQSTAILTDDLHAVKRIHKQIQKIQKLLKQR